MPRHAIALPGRSNEPALASEPRRAKWALAVILAAAAFAGHASDASAQSQDAIAEQLNEEGKALMLDRKPAEASKRFADAATRSPNPRYFYNLCKAYHFQGMFFEAMDACSSARKNSPDASLSGKIEELEKLIRSAAQEQNIDLSKPPVAEPDPETPDGPQDPDGPQPPQPTTGPQPPRGVPPSNIYQAIAPRHEYVWTAGADLTFGSSNLGIEEQDDSFFGVRLRLDYMLLPALQIGAQGYLDFLQISNPDIEESEISVANFGGALYKHFCIDRFCLTPLAGVQLGAIDNASLGNNEFETFAFGARLEAGLSAALGARFEHVIGLQVGTLVYGTPGESDELMFDKGGSLPYASIGYTYRFNTPFGTAPILGLE